MSTRIERSRVLFDLDGVLADFDGRVEELMVETNPKFVVPPRTNFYMTKRGISPTDIELARIIQHSKGFFLSLPPIDGGVDAWHHVKDLGYHPQICSSPISGNPWCIPEKREWIDAHLGPDAVDEAFIGKDKSLCSGIALIDDRPEVRGFKDADWQHILYTQGYNQHIDTEFRIDEWSDYELIDALLALCALRNPIIRSRNIE